jgi:subtilisin family serine protease
MLFVVAAGNESADNDVDSPRQVFPASLRLPNLISVAASTQDDQLAAVSNYGRTTVDLAAPGENVGSTMPLFLGADFPYGLGTGTSLAAPHVVGAVALLLARNPDLSYAQLKDLIISNVDPLPAFAGKTVSGGRLNIYKALAVAAGPGVARSETFAASGARFGAAPIEARLTLHALQSDEERLAVL